MQNTATPTGLTSAQLRRAAELKERIEELETDFKRTLKITVSVGSATPPQPQPQDKRSSIDARRTASLRMKRQWRKARRLGKSTLGRTKNRPVAWR